MGHPREWGLQGLGFSQTLFISRFKPCDVDGASKFGNMTHLCQAVNSADNHTFSQESGNQVIVVWDMHAC